MADIPENMLVYVDETGLKKSEAIPYGWSKKGVPLQGLKSGARGNAGNIIGALRANKLIAPCIFEGNCDTQIFNEWCEKMLVPELIPGNVVILDNASFHHKETITKLCYDAGCSVIFLPPYSPDYNKIENYWHSLKTLIRRRLATEKLDLLEVAYNVLAEEAA